MYNNGKNKKKEWHGWSKEKEKRKKKLWQKIPRKKKIKSKIRIKMIEKKSNVFLQFKST